MLSMLQLLQVMVIATVSLNETRDVGLGMYTTLLSAYAVIPTCVLVLVIVISTID